MRFQILVLCVFFSLQIFAKNKRFDSIDCDVVKQQYGTVLECGDDLFSVKMGSPVEKSLYQICKANFKCKMSLEVNPRDEVTKILSAFSKGKKQPKTFDTSFDCKEAKGKAEEAVCTDETLAKLDNELGAQIKMSLEKTTETKKIRDEQKAWIKDKRNKCQDDKECLLKEYKVRLESFKNEA